MSILEVDGPGKTERGLCVEYGEGEKSALHVRGLKEFKNRIEEAAGRNLGAEISPPKGIKESRAVLS